MINNPHIHTPLNMARGFQSGDFVYVNRVPATVLMVLVNEYYQCPATRKYIVKFHAGSKSMQVVYECEISHDL